MDARIVQVVVLFVDEWFGEVVPTAVQSSRMDDLAREVSVNCLDAAVVNAAVRHCRR